MVRKIFLLFVMIGAMVSLAACGKSIVQKVDNFTPIIDNNGADPNIFHADGYYYYTKTTGDNVTLWRSKNLTTVATGEHRVLWAVDNSSDSAWAPELHRIDGVWYVYFAYNPESDSHFMYVLSNPSADPFSGKWKLTKLAGMDDKFAIDGTVLTVGSKNYFIWSGWKLNENVAQNLYISEMISPTRVKPGKIEIAHPHYPWELMETPVINEGPEAIIHGDTVNLLYSASGSWTNDYCLGLMTAKTSADLTNPASWTKKSQPIMSSTSQTFGPGHNGFAKSEDGKENWLIYHTARWDGAGWNRQVRLQKFTWNKDDTIRLNQPLAANKAAKLPSGEAARIRIAATVGKLSGHLTKTVDKAAVEPKVVRGFKANSDSLKLNFTVKAGTYSVIVYVKTANENNADDTDALSLTLNEQKMRNLTVMASQYYQPVQFRAKLDSKNTLKIGSEYGGRALSIDRVELVKEK